MLRTEADATFFRERDQLRRPGVHRSLMRARVLAGALGIEPGALAAAGPPVLSVVGSKGKGTTATYASATLAAAGLRVGTLTSPGFRSNRERIRVDGQAISEATFAALAAEIDRVRVTVAAPLPGSGYLSPTGLFTLAAVRHFLTVGVDVMVLEAGMGGMSDEISLFGPRVVAVAAIFAEHLGPLGDSISGIAANKLGVISANTRRVVSVVQPHRGVMVQVAEASRGRVLSWVGGDRRDELAGTSDWPPGLIGINADLGVAAAKALLTEMAVAAPTPDIHARVLRSIKLPGRLSVHGRGAQTWALDAAINGTGARAARDWCTTILSDPDTVVVCLPDEKDRLGVLAALSGLRVRTVRIDVENLSFTEQPDAPDFADLDLYDLGKRVLALGTISFIGAALDMLDVDTESTFRVDPITDLSGHRESLSGGSHVDLPGAATRARSRPR